MSGPNQRTIAEDVRRMADGAGSEIPTLITATVYNTSGDHQLVAAPGAGKHIVLRTLVVQVQGASDQTITVKAGSNTIYGPLQVVAGNVVTFGMHPLPENTALVVNNSVSEDVSVSGNYYVRDL